MAHIPNVHANQTGRADDDHTQYQTDARADARYPRKAGGSGASGNYPINVTGTAASSPYAGSSSSTGGTQHMNGRKFYWNGSVGVKTYLWGASNNGDGRVIYQANYSRSDHNHSGVYSWLFGYNHLDVGTLAGSTGYGPWAVAHGLQGNAPKAAMATAIYDDGGHSVIASIGNLWDGTNILLTARNLNASAGEACWVSHISWV
jgi:hypothetical protein